MKLSLASFKLSTFVCCRSAEAIMEDDGGARSASVAVKTSKSQMMITTHASTSITPDEDDNVNGAVQASVAAPVAAADDALIDVYPLALSYLPSTEIARLTPTCRNLRVAGDEALPSVLANELRPILPLNLVKRIDGHSDSRNQWIKFANEWRRRSYVRADADSEGGALVPQSQEANETGEGTDALEAVLTKPEVSACLVDSCNPADFAAWLRTTEDLDTLGDLCFRIIVGHDDVKNKLTETGEANIGVRPDKFDDFCHAVIMASPRRQHYLFVEITAAGGKPLRLEDGTPLAMWVDGIGGGASPRTSSVSVNEGNEDAINEMRQKLAPRCTCEDCDNILEPILPDRGMMTATGLLLDEPYLASEFRGCEEGSYGRMVIHEDDLEDLSFSDGYDPMEVVAPEGEEDYYECHHPNPDSLHELFEVTMKAVRYHPVHGPSVVTIMHCAPLGLATLYLGNDEENAGAIQYEFQTPILDGEVDDISLEVSFKNCAKLFNFSSEKFESDQRPTSNQLWLMDWEVGIIKVDRSTDPPTGEPMARSELFRRCGLLEGL